MINFYTNGLYSEPFYKKVSDLVYDQGYLISTLSDNFDVFLKHYSKEMKNFEGAEGVEKLGELEPDQGNTCKKIIGLLLAKLSCRYLYFQPLVLIQM